MATLLFGIGATKAGTSWLHRYLSDHPQCHMRAIKELHYFDALDWSETDRQVAEIEKRKVFLKGRLETDNKRQFANALRQLGHLEHWLTVLARGDEDIPAYLGYLEGGLEDERVVGDITPAYSLLAPKRLRAMSQITPDVRFIYLMRDPVARLWSHIRMMASRRGGTPGNLQARANHIFERWAEGEERQLDRRGDYGAALTRIAEALPPGRCLTMFYEELFTKAGVTRICDHLGLDYRPGNFDKRVLEGERAKMSAAQARRARTALAAQYDHVAQAMGALPEAWRATEKV